MSTLSARPSAAGLDRFPPVIDVAKERFVPPVDEHKRHELYLAIEASIGSGPAETLMSMIPPATWDDLVTRDVLDQRLEATELRLRATLHEELWHQTRTLMLGLIGAMATMTSLCLGAIALIG